MKLINGYKIKDGITQENIKEEIKRKHLPYNEGHASYIHKNAIYSTDKILDNDISVCIGFPEDLSKWDDFAYVLVLDESFGQPYTPFYHVEEHERYQFPFVLNIVGRYNKFMDSLEFLERIK